MNETYEATAVRSGAWWHLEVPDLEGVYTQVKRLAEGPSMIAEVLELIHDIKVDATNVRVRPAEPGLSKAVGKWADMVAEAN